MGGDNTSLSFYIFASNNKYKNIMYLTKDYFTREPIRIQGIDNTTGGVETDFAIEMQNRVEQYAAIYEKKFLSAMLGENYVELLEDNPTLKDAIYNTQTYISPVANYIYYKLWADTISENTMSGNKIVTADGSQVLINVAKMVTVWNLMRDMVINILMDTEVEGITPDFASEIFSDINGIGI